MRKLFYLFVFIFSFLFFLVITFPVSTVLSFYLNKYGIKYEKIEGNLLKFHITGLQYQNFYVRRIDASLSFKGLKINVNGSTNVYLFPVKRVDIHFKNAELDSFQQKPVISGTLTGKLSLYLSKSVKIDGYLKIDLREVKTFGIKGIMIDANLKPSEKGSHIEAKVRGTNINGVFKGDITIPSKRIVDTTIKGTFEGTFYRSKIKQKINVKLANFMR